LDSRAYENKLFWEEDLQTAYKEAIFGGDIPKTNIAVWT
jgi:hypothetical protein